MSMQDCNDEINDDFDDNNNDDNTTYTGGIAPYAFSNGGYDDDDDLECGVAMTQYFHCRIQSRTSLQKKLKFSKEKKISIIIM